MTQHVILTRGIDTQELQQTSSGECTDPDELWLDADPLWHLAQGELDLQHKRAAPGNQKLRAATTTDASMAWHQQSLIAMPAEPWALRKRTKFTEAAAREDPPFV